MKPVVSNSFLMLCGGFVKVILQALAEQSRIVRLPLNKVGLTNRIQKAYSASWSRNLKENHLQKNWQNCLNMDLEEVYCFTWASMPAMSAWTLLYLKAKKVPCWMYLENPNAEKTDGELDHNAIFENRN